MCAAAAPPRGRLSPGLLAQIVCVGEESRAQGHRAAQDIPWQLSCNSCLRETPGIPAPRGEGTARRAAAAQQGSALHRDGTGSAGRSCASKEVLFLKKASGCVFPVQVGDTGGFCSRMRVLLVQDSSVFVRQPSQRLPELQLSLSGQEDGKGQRECARGAASFAPGLWEGEDLQEGVC